LEFEYTYDNQVAILELVGSVQLYEIHNLRDKFDDMKELEIRKVIVDLSRVDHIDSSGLGLLIAQASRYKEKGVPFIVTGVNHSIEYLFKLTTFLKIFKRLPTIQDAKEFW
jgi:anti-anti-sigma factor